MSPCMPAVPGESGLVKECERVGDSARYEREAADIAAVLEAHERDQVHRTNSLYVRFDWPTCAEADCSGVATRQGGLCARHAEHGDPESFARALADLRDTGGLDLRGVSVSAALLETFLSAAPSDSERKPYLLDANFQAACFEDAVAFGGVVLKGTSNFNGARFKKAVSFRVFDGPAYFQDTRFEDYVGADGATFNSYVRLDSAVFHGPAHLGANFRGEVICPGADFREYAQFLKATFEGGQGLGEFTGKAVNMAMAEFAGPVSIRADVEHLDLGAARFRGRTDIHMRRGVLSMPWATFEARSTVAGPGDSPPPVKVASVSHAVLGDMAFRDVDLSQCRFVGAHNLDRLTVTGSTRFGSVGGRWERRTVTADELAWRASVDPRRWKAPGWPEEVGRPAPAAPRADEVRAVYRDLRKGREDAKDEPSAADFYYGEMEMRRLEGRERADGVRRGRAERAILTFYWIVSGYGLRASRATLALLTTIAASSMLLWAFGFTPRQSPMRTTLYALESSSSLFRPPDKTGLHLTYTGEFVEIALRLLAPLFLGFILLSLRGRIKR